MVAPLPQPRPPTTPVPPFAASVEDVAAGLHVDPALGLEGDEADRRAAESGANELERREPTSVLSMVVEAATEPFVLLLGAAAVGAILLGETRDGLLILIGLIPIVGADVVTEYRGDRALDALRDASAPVARVRRDGEVEDIAAARLVRGDVVLLRAGDVVPADVRLTRADRMVVDQSLLTGESVPESRSVAPDRADAALTDRRSTAYAGTSVVAGRGEGIVVAIGRETEVGRIAGRLGGRRERRSPLQLELDRLVRILLVVAVALIAIVTLIGFTRGRSLGENLLAGISAAIASIPEEPPILLAVILGLGAYRLLRKGVLVRRLNAEEVLGAIDLIVTDKTGTLTMNRLEVASVVDLTGPVTDDAHRRALLEDALRAEDDAWARADGTAPGSFTRALERAVEAAGGIAVLDPADLIDGSPVEDSRPYTSTTWRRRAREARSAAVVHEEADLDALVGTALGAPEAILALASATGEADRGAWHALIEERTASGERVVALARRTGDAAWSIEALVGFADPVRDGIAGALSDAIGAGIQTLVVTGDHPATAAAIARAAGLGGERIVTGDELGLWDDARLTDEIPSLHVIARSTPDQKERIVRLARGSGRMVAVTGDGVNDAPALNAADVAVAMGTGTAVAKEAADLVLGDDSFATLMYGLREGRRIVDNIQKGLTFLVSTHVAFLGFILIATIAGHDQPLLPIQILWMELFIDTTTSVAFEREPEEPDIMRRPPRKPGVPLLTTALLGRIALAGGFSAVAALWIMTTHGPDAEHARWVAYTALVCAQVVRAYMNRSLRTPITRLGPNRLLLGAAVAVVVIQAAIPFIPGLREAFRASPLGLDAWLVVALVAAIPAVVAEAIRRTRGIPWVA